ncbi:MAG: hypothetical protein PHX21_12710 [bacterium]|nr:hypothetical protein [bacterium]
MLVQDVKRVVVKDERGEQKELDGNVLQTGEDNRTGYNYITLRLSNGYTITLFDKIC